MKEILVLALFAAGFAIGNAIAAGADLNAAEKANGPAWWVWVLGAFAVVAAVLFRNKKKDGGEQ